MKKVYDVVVVSGTGIDTNVYLHGSDIGFAVEANFTENLDYVGQAGGYCSRGFAQLGKKTALIDYIGNDHSGKFIREELIGDGIDVSAVFADPAGTGRSINFMYGDGRRKNSYDGKGSMDIRLKSPCCAHRLLHDTPARSREAHRILLRKGNWMSISRNSNPCFRRCGVEWWGGSRFPFLKYICWSVRPRKQSSPSYYFERESAMTSQSKNCQSCGMPLSKDPQGGGTEANGTKSAMYCSHCYQQGKFTLPDLTVQQMQERVKSRMKEMGFPGFLSGFFTRSIPNLERWKNRKVGA